MSKRNYVDTSALRHALSPSPRTADIRRLLDDEAQVCATSQIAITELHRTALLAAGVSPVEVDDVLEKLDLIDVDAGQLRRAGLLPPLPAGGQLRSLDAIHIQAALDIGATAFVTSDKRQAKAAKAAGLVVTVL